MGFKDYKYYKYIPLKSRKAFVILFYFNKFFSNVKNKKLQSLISYIRNFLQSKIVYDGVISQINKELLKINCNLSRIDLSIFMVYLARDIERILKKKRKKREWKIRREEKRRIQIEEEKKRNK